MSGRCTRAVDLDPLRYLKDSSGAAARDLREHARSCADCRLELAAWEALGPERLAEDAHPQPELLVVYADQRESLAPDDLRLVSEHLTDCPSCRDEVLVLERVRITPVERLVPGASMASSPERSRAAAWLEHALAATKRPAFAYVAIVLLVVPTLAIWALRGSMPAKMQMAQSLSQKTVSRTQSVPAQRLEALRHRDDRGAPEQRRVRKSPLLGRMERDESEDVVGEMLAGSSGAGPAAAPPPAVLPEASSAVVPPEAAVDASPVVVPPDAPREAAPGGVPLAASSAPPVAAQAAASPSEPSAGTSPTRSSVPLSALSSSAGLALGAPTVDLDEQAAGAMVRRENTTASRIARSAPRQKGISVQERTIEFRAGLRQEVDRADLADGFIVRLRVVATRDPAVEASARPRVQAEGAEPVVAAPAGSTLEVRVLDLSSHSDLRHRRRLEVPVQTAVAQSYAPNLALSTEAIAKRESAKPQVVDVWVDMEQLGAGPYRIEVRVAGVDEALAEPMELRLRAPD